MKRNDGMRRVVLAGLALSLFLGFKLLGVMFWDTGENRRPNLLLITLDTCRKDHLSAYGYSRETSPELSRLARDGFRFDNAYTVATNSAPSHAVILTGQTPSQHGLIDNGMSLSSSAPTLARYLSRRGYDTAAFVGFYALAEESGLNRGFETFKFIPVKSHEHSGKSLEKDVAGLEQANAWIRNWMNRYETRSGEGNAQGAKGNFFVWIHVQNIHESYDPPPPYDSIFMDIPEKHSVSGFEGEFNIRCANDLADAWRKAGLPVEVQKRVKALYDGEIRLVDDYLKKIFDGLRAGGHYQNTVVSVLADHGERLFETSGENFAKKGPGHTGRYYDPVVGIPWILKPSVSPGFLPGQVVKPMVSTHDHVPTILELLGYPVPGWATGSSRMALLANPELESNGEKVFFQESPYGVPFSGVRTPRWKLVEKKVDGGFDYWLSDLTEDSLEINNVYASRPEEAERLKGLLKQWKEGQGGADRVARREMSQKMRQSLRDGGYLRD